MGFPWSFECDCVISLEGLENLSQKEIKEMLLKNNIVEIIDDDIYIPKSRISMIICFCR